MTAKSTSVVRLGDVTDILDSRRVPVNRTERDLRPGSIPYYGATGHVGFIDTHLFDEELVLLGEDGAPFLDPAKPKAFMIRGKSWVNNHAHVLRGKAGVMLNAFLLHQLNAVNYRPFVSGTTRLKLPQGPMREIPLIAPSIDRQVAVVNYLDEQLTRLDASMATLHRVQANLKRYRASVLKSACEGRLVPTEAELARQEGRDFETSAQLLQRILAERQELPQIRRKAKERSAPVIDGLPQLPESWCWATLESIASVTGGLAKSGSRVANAPMREVPYLRVANVQRGYLELSEIKTILATEKDIADLRLVPGDVLFNEGGDRDKLGRGHIWNGEVPEAIHQNHVFRARASQHHVLPQYLSMCGNGYGVHWFSDYATQSVNLASISLSTLRKFPVALPPLAEQHRIVAEADRRLSLIRVAEAQVAANLARAQRLRQSILQAAFTIRA